MYEGLCLCCLNPNVHFHTKGSLPTNGTVYKMSRSEVYYGGLYMLLVLMYNAAVSGIAINQTCEKIETTVLN